MKRLPRAAFLIVGAAVLAAAVYYLARNPEGGPLDDAARAEAGGHYLALSDGTTHYDQRGPDGGQPVVLVHGFSVPYYIWDSTAIALAAAGFRVIRYDVFGRGASDRPRARYDADLYDRQLGELLDSLGITQPVHLMGLSAGGPVVATFAGRHPGRVRSVTLIDPAAGDWSPLPWPMRLPLIGPLIWQAMVVPGLADGQLSDFVEPTRWPDWPDRYRPQMRFRGFGRALWASSMAMEGVKLDSVYAAMARTGLPVMLVWGREDQTVPIALSDRLLAAIPQVRFEPIDGAAHLPHMERTDLVNPLLIGFLGGSAESRESPP